MNKSLIALLLFLPVFLFSCRKDGPDDNGQVTEPVYLEVNLSSLSYPAPEAVDLGLSVKWANCNLGARKEYETGYYFAWGETVPKASFSSGNHAYSNPGGLIELAPGDDAARANLGGKWRMPTRWEMWELWDFVANGDGQLKYERRKAASGKSTVFGAVISNTTTGKSIFLPCAGRVDGTLIESFSGYGYYWTSSLSRGGADGTAGSYCIGFDGTLEVVNEWTCGSYYGMPIRPVCDK